MSRRRIDGALPTPAQVELLQAAVLPGDGARLGWQRWRSRGLDIDDLDDASARILPQLWLNRDAAGVGASDVPLLRGVYRQALAMNAYVLRDGLEGVAALERAGVPVVLIKGGATLARASERLGTRVLHDLDVLVEEHRARDGIRALVAAGFAPDPGIVRRVLETRHAWSFRRAGGPSLDLHWHAYKTPGDDATVFEQAEVRTLLDRPVAVPALAEALLQTCVHGVGPYPAPVRWVGDAALLARDAGADDWERLASRARDRQVTVAAGAALAVLRDEVGADVPAWVVERLRAEPATWRERIAHRTVIDGSRVADDACALEFHRCRGLHHPADTPGFLNHLAHAVGARNGRTIVWLLGRRIGRRLRRGYREPWVVTVSDWNRARRRSRAA